MRSYLKNSQNVQFISVYHKNTSYTGIEMNETHCATVPNWHLEHRYFLNLNLNKSLGLMQTEAQFT